MGRKVVGGSPATSASSWGRLPFGPSEIVDLSDATRALRCIAAAGPSGLAYGNGRSYGDVCLNPGGRLWRTRRLDRFIAFDRTRGILRCEAGLLLDGLLQLTLAQGWFLPVSPGTQFVTVGGAIANDVHGKNHHRAGTFGRHVRSLTLARTDGSVVTCSSTSHGLLFRATIGGLGLTGVILDAELQLRPVQGPWIDVETIAFSGLDAFFDLSSSSEAAYEYTIAWIDCAAHGARSGRGIFLRANHSSDRAALARKRPKRMFFTPPVSLVNRLSLAAFNDGYYNLNRLKQGRSRQHYLSYFYPLDNLLEWNRLYGPRGFFQYQSVVPTRDARAATQAMLDAIARAGTGSFLAVLKVFGGLTSPGLLSFPMQGTTLALDFPNLGDRTHALFDRLDAIVSEAGGRLYPAKDARMPRTLFARGYPALEEFTAYRDPGIDSAMARRLLT
jgi:FAD/FMN-containing dehydrogenase